MKVLVESPAISAAPGLEARLDRYAALTSGVARGGDLALYLAHVVDGAPIRAVARATAKAPSTVSRAVARVEARREDPLIDALITQIETGATGPNPAPWQAEPQMKRSTTRPRMSASDIAVLRRLSEPEAFLMVAREAEKAGVFGRVNGFRRPLMMIDLTTATHLLTRDWTVCARRTEQSARYEITEAGRAALRRALSEAKAEMAPRPATDGADMSVFTDQHQMCGVRRIANIETGEIETVRVNLGESPLGWLSRRKKPNGEPLLSAVEVEAGERLREDFEMAQIGPKVGQDWRSFLTPAGPRTGETRTPSEGPMFARERVASAMEALGPGLSDVALRVCCFLEGLEATERRMGWAARSGKVVLGLALQRLARHYGLVQDEEAAA